MIVAFVHPKAHVEGSKLGAGTHVWQFASIVGGAVLGNDCSVAPHAMLDGCRFGDRVRVGPSVSMGPGFVVGDDCFIGPSVTFCNDMWPRADKHGFDVEPMRSGEFVTIRVGNGVCIGANAVILPGVTIGDGAVIAAGAVCGKDVPARHLFKRDGKIVEITPAWTKCRRMRRAKEA